MRTPLSRFAVVGTLVTAVDVGTFALLRQASGRRDDTARTAAADVAAVSVAGAVSYGLHRALTFRDDPYDRWLDRRGTFAGVGVISGAIDVALVSAAHRRWKPGPAGSAAIKLGAVGVAGVARWVLHRRVLFAIVRDDAVARPERVVPEGSYRLSVVVPAYHEVDRIADSVATIRHALRDVDGGVEIVVVDDGSGDGTAEAARQAGADLVIEQVINRGKGAAVRAGVLAANGRTIAFTDADLAYDPAQITGLLDQVEAGWDMVVGSRKHDATRTLVRRGRLREVGGRVINWLTHAVVLGHYRDTQCGLKAFRADVGRELFARSHIDGFAFDVELFVAAERNRVAVAEVPVTVTNTTRSTVNVVRDAARLVRDLLRIRRMARRGTYRFEVPPASTTETLEVASAPAPSEALGALPGATAPAATADRPTAAATHHHRSRAHRGPRAGHATSTRD